MGDVEPPSGLGNFKGVMLCNRPEEGPPVQEAGPKPFRTTVAASYGEQLGLNPPPREEEALSLSTKPKNEALVRHSQWLKQLATHVADTKEDNATMKEKEQQKLKAVQDFCERQRQQVKELREEAKKVNKELSRADLAKAVEGKLKKPKWAMTEKASDDLDEEETIELLDFADNLNFDEYMNDLDFREAVVAMKGRANKLAKEQDDFRSKLIEQFNESDDDEEAPKPPAEEGDIEIEGQSAFDEDARSMMTSVTSASRQGRKDKERDRESDWDSSTRTSETQSSIDSEATDFAKRVLEENPKMRGVHSAASIQKIAEKVQADKEKEAVVDEKQAAQERMLKEAKVAALVQALQEEKGPPMPLIQVHTEDARCNKPVDPSMLPYLYRSPAI